MIAFQQTLMSSRPENLIRDLGSVVKETHAARKGKPFPRTIVRYLAACFLMNALTAFGTAGLTHLPI